MGVRKCYALYLAKLGRPKEAAEEAEKALAQAPKDRNVLYWAGRVYAVLGNWLRAEELVKAALALGYDRRSLEHEPDLTPKSNRVKSQGSSR